MERFHRESKELCRICHGTGLVLVESVTARAKRGGNSSYLVSLISGQLSMSERGSRGGRPREFTLADLRSQQS